MVKDADGNVRYEGVDSFEIGFSHYTGAGWHLGVFDTNSYFSWQHGLTNGCPPLGTLNNGYHTTLTCQTCCKKLSVNGRTHNIKTDAGLGA